MSKFLLLIFVSLSANAFTLEKYQSSPGTTGVERQTFDFSGKITTYHRGTNIFDKDLSDHRIGTLVPLDQKAIDKRMKPLREILAKIEAVDQYLKKQEGTSFNEVAGSPGHGTVILLDKKIILGQSKFFAELDKIFNELKDEKWKMVSGYEFPADLKYVNEYVNEYVKGVATKKEFSKGMYCDRASRSCTYYGGGKVVFKDDIF